MAAQNNTTVIQCGYVPPNHPSGTQLGGGKYALNRRSNVPFVALVGSHGYKKTIGWGEIAEVPRGELVTVYNASYHGGDIFINKGDSPAGAPPNRISVPVQFTTTLVNVTEGIRQALQTSFPCDTRGAKNAWLSIDAFVAAASLTIFIRGRRLDGSMKTNNSLKNYNKPFGPGIGYLSSTSYINNTNLYYIPLGQGADDSHPQNMLDASDVFLIVGADGAALTGYMTWPAGRNATGWPTGIDTDYPGAWYVIEY